jgi:hypothetical protein
MDAAISINLCFYVSNISPVNTDLKSFSGDPEIMNELRMMGIQQFRDTWLLSLAKKYSLKVWKIDGAAVQIQDLFNEGNLKQDGSTKKGKPDTDKKPDPKMRIATLNGEKITLSDLLNFFEATIDEFEMMAVKFGTTLIEVIWRATVLFAEHMLTQQDMKNSGEAEKLKKMFIESATIAKFNMKISSPSDSDIKKIYDEYMNLLSKEEKSPKELSVKILLFADESKAHEVLSSMKSGTQSFNSLFNQKDPKAFKAIDLGYVNVQTAPEGVWNVVQSVSNGTASKEIVKMVRGSDSGFAIPYVGDRRDAAPPSLNDPGTKKIFADMAARKLVIDIIVKNLKHIIEKIEGISADDWLTTHKSQTDVFRVISKSFALLEQTGPGSMTLSIKQQTTSASDKLSGEVGGRKQETLTSPKTQKQASKAMSK